jgi:hypothetical protein
MGFAHVLNHLSLGALGGHKEQLIVRELVLLKDFKDFGAY